ncbi:hypothetical protein [Liberiplasma polymorphum]|uniref:hypothetical protein n=1 Tax=Liberiplasma polymorphum TaxID=3374570 RepID=UPI0037758363
MKPFVLENGKFNMVKLLITSIAFSIFIAIIVMLVEMSSIWLIQYMPGLLMLVFILVLIHITILIINDLKQLYFYLKQLVVKILFYQPLIQLHEAVVLVFKEDMINKRQSHSHEKLCVFRC